MVVAAWVTLLGLALTAMSLHHLPMMQLAVAAQFGVLPVIAYLEFVRCRALWRGLDGGNAWRRSMPDAAAKGVFASVMAFVVLTIVTDGYAFRPAADPARLDALMSVYNLER